MIFAHAQTKVRLVKVTNSEFCLSILTCSNQKWKKQTQ